MFEPIPVFTRIGAGFTRNKCGNVLTAPQLTAHLLPHAPQNHFTLLPFHQFTELAPKHSQRYALTTPSFVTLHLRTKPTHYVVAEALGARWPGRPLMRPCSPPPTLRLATGGMDGRAEPRGARGRPRMPDAPAPPPAQEVARGDLKGRILHLLCSTL